MKHVGDITKLHGDSLPPVDIITGGSPCQDLSVAGKRAGLAGERSGLFMEQIRIIKEMREYDRSNGRADVDIRPRYMVWENVPGALSSNKGEDFRAVLEETARITEETAFIPGPPKEGWHNSGCIMGDGWSIAWRIHDAQFWGVPQRRRRIALVADFAGRSAAEILFEREGVSGDPEQSSEEGEDTSHRTKTRPGEAISFQERAGKPGGARESLSSGTEQEPYQRSITNQSCPNPIGFNRERSGAVFANDLMPTLQAAAGESGNNKPMVAYGLDQQGGKGGGNFTENVAPTMAGDSHGTPHAVAYGISAYQSNSMKSSNPNSGVYEADTTRTLDLNGGNPACNQGGMAIVCLEGNGQRDSHHGDGYKVSDTMYTLNTVEVHGVVTKGNGDAFLNDKTHTSLSSGGGQAGQGYPCVLEVKAVDCRNGTVSEVNGPLQHGGIGVGVNLNNVVMHGKEDISSE